jgi:hypothetical protein
LTHGRSLARQRGIANLAFEVASVYHLPFIDASFDAAFTCALLQHLIAPVAAPQRDPTSVKAWRRDRHRGRVLDDHVSIPDESAVRSV